MQESAGFSVMGEAAVAGMDAATLEQHAAWVDNGTVGRRDAARRTPDDDRELIAALALTAATLGRIPEQRRPEVPAGAPRPPAVLSLLDLAMPRDIDAAAHRLAGVRLVDIESLAEASADAPMAADVDQVRRHRRRRGRRLRGRPAGRAHHPDRRRAAHHGRRCRRR